MEASQQYARRTEIIGRDRKRTQRAPPLQAAKPRNYHLSHNVGRVFRCSGATALTTARVQNAASSSTSRQAVRANSASKQYERVRERCGNRQPSPQGVDKHHECRSTVSRGHFRTGDDWIRSGSFENKMVRELRSAVVYPMQLARL